jgi:hypothetical protein
MLMHRPSQNAYPCQPEAVVGCLTRWGFPVDSQQALSHSIFFLPLLLWRRCSVSQRKRRRCVIGLVLPLLEGRHIVEAAIYANGSRQVDPFKLNMCLNLCRSNSIQTPAILHKPELGPGRSECPCRNCHLTAHLSLEPCWTTGAKELVFL